MAFLEKYLFTASDNVQLLLLKILCEAGKPVSECLQGYFGKHDKGEEIPGVVAAELIRLAELQDDPETISAIISMEERNRHAGILALKRMGAEECLAPLLSSKDKTLSDLVRGFMK
ncbi:MAG: hypothetical protein J6Y62_01440 [Clostridia bacterium]|nr:hypothetical protein [Clostridia bacterium]